MSEVEGRPVAQATAVDALFGDLPRRAAANVRDYHEAFDRNLKLALKAQNQCRLTWERLDTGTEGEAGGGNPAMEAVGAANRAKVG